MKEAFSSIYLGWRPPTSEDRYLIGLITKQADKLTFSYIYDEVMKAARRGFFPYIEFRDTSKTYDEYVLEIFAQRLTPKSRYKTSPVFKFWEISESILEDRLATLAFTQAMLPTDNFEFLADFHPRKGLTFITDLIDLSLLPGALLAEGDQLTWERKTSEDGLEQQIIVSYENQKVGQVKRVHSNVFNTYEGNIRLRVHSTEKKESLRKAFVKIELL
ncbi:hypothetical protein [Spirosoma sp.]|uniref:hypothetical protein n=1 Tax=Spirosoma sp. TaxID=1899569 RepID=UPI002610C633|nr:hypothetical protein [Spirosoma sp.]MCX6214658.1 hypothetical protein [Spirosoma sp.]